MAHEREGDEIVFHDVEDAVIKAEKKVEKAIINAEKRLEERVWRIEQRLEHALGVDKAVGFNDPAAKEFMAHEREGDEIVFHDVEQAVIDAEKKLEQAIVDTEKKAMFTEVHEHMSLNPEDGKPDKPKPKQ
mmetsp:Transcript_12025/g.31462  ORF Transcript_12025/g.31462 Transcript_12025/m.31462 type:complete len:131 (-) Transcript_12025:193-585(-)